MTHPPSKATATNDLPRWQRALARALNRPTVDLTIGVLIIASVLLTLVEFGLYPTGAGAKDDRVYTLLQGTNDALTWLFIVELSLRFAAARAKPRFFREYWIDIIAVMPWCRILRVGRAMRLLRLIRVLRLFGFASRTLTRRML